MIDENPVNFFLNDENPDRTLNDSQERYDLLLGLSNDGILIIQDGKIRESNDLVAQMCGYAVEEILDTDFASFFQPEDIMLFCSLSRTLPIE